MNPILREIADYLISRDTGSPVDPVGVRPALLPHFYILDVLTDSAGLTRLRVRLTGTALDRAFGRSLRGQQMEDFMHGPRSQEVLRGFHACAKTHAPLWMRQVVEIRGRPPRYVEGVAVFVDPNLIYGGLMVGDVVGFNERAGFESCAL